MCPNTIESVVYDLFVSVYKSSVGHLYLSHDEEQINIQDL